jgi:hypothetical protein
MLAERFTSSARTSSSAAGGLSQVRRQDGRVALTPCSDLSPASWIMASDRPWQQLVGFGPAGFSAHARLRFRPDPAYEGQRENDVEIDGDPPSETERLRAVLKVLTRHTRTPDDCYFCLWDGWVSTSRVTTACGSSTGQGAPFERGHRLRRHSRPRCCAGRRLSYRTAPTTCSAGRCQTSATGAQLRCGQENFDSTCAIPRSSGRPTMPGVSPMTSTHTGPGSELTSGSSTSFWLIQNSTSSQPTHARTSLSTSSRPHPGFGPDQV